MIIAMRVICALLFVAITIAVVRASLDTPLWAIPNEVTGDAWFRTTMLDIYIAFAAFFAWVAYKERNWTARTAWGLAIACLGSMAITAYCLRELFRVRTDASFEDVLLRRRKPSSIDG